MALDVQEQIEQFQEFLQNNYENKIQEILTEGKKSLIVDFKLLSSFDIELAEFLLNDPENAIKAAELSITQMFIPEEVSLKIRFENLPESQRISIKDIRSSHLTKFLAVDGIIRQTSDVRPQITMAKFECPSCGNTISILQVETRFKEPNRCTCGRRGSFRLIHKDLVDAQRLVIEEVPERLEGGAQPKRISVFLKEDLVEPKLEKKTTPGAKVRVNGILREVPIMLKTGAQSIRYDLMIDANFVESVESTFEDVEISKEEEKLIKELAKDPLVYQRLRNSIAPSIFGHENIKDALVLQLMGGVKKEKKDGTKTRGNMHMLLIGDPGSAKSTLLLSMSKVAPKARYVAGRGASSAGLCIAPDSLIMKNPGELIQIKDEVEKQFENGSEEYLKDINRTTNKTGVKVYSVDNNLKINTGEVEHFWKIKSPKRMVSITLQGGKKIELTKNTKLLTINREGVLWKKAGELKESDHIATAREINIKKHQQKIDLPFMRMSSYKIQYLKRLNRYASRLNGIISKKFLLKRYGGRELEYLKILGQSDLFWERIKNISLIKPTYEYVYDITVKKAHNFIANGVIIHNTAAVVKDEFLKGWALEAGTLVLANGGYAMIDELDKISTEDTSALHEVLANEQVSISKANIQACYSEDTEVLTEVGWKKYNDVGDLKIAQYNPKDKTVRFTQHKGLYVYNYKGIMCHFKNKRIDILVTPNHRMLAREYSQKYYQVIEAKNLNYNCIKFVNSGKYISKEKPYFILPPIQHKQNRIHLKYIHQHKAKIIPMKLWLEFLGFFITEGGFERPPTIGIVQKKGFVADKIELCLRRLSKILGFTLTKMDYDPYVRFKITQTQIYEYLRRFGRLSYCKSMNLNFSELSKEQLESLYCAMMMGDGADDGGDFGSTSERLLDEFQAIAFLIGRSACKSIQYKAGTKGRREMYRVSLCDKTEPSIGRKAIKKVSYKGKVFCFSTKTGFFVTRRNGKITIQGNTLRAETTLLSAANPKFGRFDPYQPIAAQINLPPALINRFDLIFPVRDIPNKEKDEKIASHVLETMRDVERSKPEISNDFMKKYVSYARQKCKPQLTDRSILAIKNFYVNLRNSGNSGEGELAPIPISARQLEAIVRLAEASARVRLGTKVTVKDAERAINIMMACLQAVGIDPKTGKIDIDMISTGITSSTRSRIVNLREIIVNLTETKGKTIAVGDLIEEAKKKDISETEVYDILEKLKKEGELYEPKKGFISRI